MGVSLVNVQQQTKDFLHLFRRTVTFRHVTCQFTFSCFVTALGLFKDLVLRGWDRLALQQADDVGRCTIGNGKVQRGVVVVILLRGALGVSVVEGFDDFQGSIVVSVEGVARAMLE